MYNIGDKVVYPMHGAGSIVSIEEKEVMGKKQSYYILEQDETEMEKNWNKRYRENMDKIKSGNIYEIADVVRNLSFKQKEKGLSTGEKKMLYNAKQILISELVLAEHSTQDEVEQLVENKINSSYALFRTDGNIEEVSAGSIVNKFIPFNENE